MRLSIQYYNTSQQKLGNSSSSEKFVRSENTERKKHAIDCNASDKNLDSNYSNDKHHKSLTCTNDYEKMFACFDTDPLITFLDTEEDDKFAASVYGRSPDA